MSSRNLQQLHNSGYLKGSFRYSDDCDFDVHWEQVEHRQHKRDVVGVTWDPRWTLFEGNNSGMMISIPKHWKTRPNVLTNPRGKPFNMDNLFVHWAKTFPNPFNFVVITFSIYLRVFPKKPAASKPLSPADVMDPDWEDYADGGGDDRRLSQRETWSPRDKSLGGKWRGVGPCINLSYLQKWAWPSTKWFHCKFSVLVAFPLTTANSSSRQQETNHADPRQ